MRVPVLVVLSVLGVACGYSSGSGLRGPSNNGIRTVRVTAVANDTYRQRLEVDLKIGRAHV